jgi:di/tricarboxylate transporter
VLVPLILYALYPPELKDTPDAPAAARKELEKLGPLSTNEKITAGGWEQLRWSWREGVHHSGRPAKTAQWQSMEGEAEQSQGTDGKVVSGTAGISVLAHWGTKQWQYMYRMCASLQI